MALMGLDVGSSGCKAIIFSLEGKILAHAYEEYPRTDNVYETNGTLIWESVQKVIQSCCTQSTELPQAICISSFGESFVPIDKDGNVLMNTMLYTDNRGSAQVDRLREQLDTQRSLNITGVKSHPMYSLSKICYIKETYPELYQKVYQFLLIGSFIIHRLTGECVIDYSLAARTGLFDVRKKIWSKDICAITDIDPDKLPRPIPSGVSVGSISASLARELSIPVTTQVITGGHDQVCASIGAGVLDSSNAVDGMGTVECITPIFDRAITDQEFLMNNYACVPYVLDGKYATYAFNFTAGALLDWFQRNFAKQEAARARELGMSVYRLLDDMGAQQPTGIVTVPHFAGSATPDMNVHASGILYGLKLDTDLPKLYRSLIEGITYEMLYNLDVLSQFGIHISQLRAIGGGAKSLYWLRIKANITGRVILPLAIDEAGITGTAMMAGVAIGAYKDLAQALPYYVKVKQAIEPDAKEHAQYQELYQTFLQVRNRMNHL